ncbi:MAG: hypothetical protein IKQ46_09895 [Bacteroidales bacterium]|nr:hypothetical protein [Bacteroidales bacterium]
MKRIFSIVAALVVAMVMMVSCASQNTQDAKALIESISKNDVATATTLADKLYAAKDQLTTDESCALALGYNGLANLTKDTDLAQAQAFSQKFVEVASAVVAKDAEGVKKFADESKVNIADILNQVVAAQKAAEEAAAQAAAQAEAEAAEGEAAEGAEEAAE